MKNLKDEDPAAAAAHSSVKEKTNEKPMARKNYVAEDAPITCVGCNRSDDKKDMIVLVVRENFITFATTHL